MNTPADATIFNAVPVGKVLLLFDGVCNVCNASVQYVIERDKRGLFYFTSLQSPLGQEITAAAGLPPQSMDTVVLLDNCRVYTRSAAALRVLLLLGGIQALLYGFILIPRPLRDAVYALIAKNRYRLFGRRDYCMIPTPGIRSRFLNG